MTKSAVRLAQEALAVGERALPTYSSCFSKHDFTQPQLFALLTVKQFLKTDYRGVVTLVAEWDELRRALHLKKVPHYSTLCYAEQRLLAGAEKGGPSPGRSRRSLRAPSGWACSTARPSAPSMRPASKRAT